MRGLSKIYFIPVHCWLCCRRVLGNGSEDKGVHWVWLLLLEAPAAHELFCEEWWCLRFGNVEAAIGRGGTGGVPMSGGTFPGRSL